MTKYLRKVMVATLVVLLAVTVGTMGLGQLPVQAVKTNPGNSYLVDGAGDAPFFPPPSSNVVKPQIVADGAGDAPFFPPPSNNVVKPQIVADGAGDAPFFPPPSSNSIHIGL